MFSGKQFTDAIQNGGPALDSLRSHLEGVVTAGTHMAATAGRGAEVVGSITPAARTAAKLLGDLNAQSSGLSKAQAQEINNFKAFGTIAAPIANVADKLGLSTTAAQAYAGMLGLSVTKSGDLVDATQANISSIAAMATAFNNATSVGAGFLSELKTFSDSAGTSADRAALIGSTLAAATGDVLSFQDSLAGSAAQMDAVVEAAKKTNKSVVDLQTGAIHYRQAGAKPLLDALSSEQQSLIASAQAVYTHDKAVEGGAAAAAAAWQYYKNQLRDSLDQSGKALGLAGAPLQAYIDRYMGLVAAPNVKKLITQEGGGQVVDILESIKKDLDILAGITVSPKVNDSAVIALRNELQNLVGKNWVVQVSSTTGPVNVTGRNQAGGVNGGHLAAGGVVPEGYFTVGERGWELGRKQGNNVDIFSHAQAMAMTGLPDRLPGFADGTKYAAQLNTIGSTDLSAVVASFAQSASAVRDAFRSLTVDLSKAGASTRTLTVLLRASAGAQAAVNDKARTQALLGSPASAPTAYDRLATAVGNYNDERSSVASAVTGSFNPATAGADANGNVTGGLFLAQSEQNAVLVQRFVSEMQQLKGRVTDAYWSQLASAGPSAEPQVRALLSLTKAQLHTISNDYASSVRLGNQLGTSAAQRLYGGSVSSAQANVKALTDRLHRDDSAIEARLSSLEKTLHADLVDLRHRPSVINADQAVRNLATATRRAGRRP